MKQAKTTMKPPKRHLLLAALFALSPISLLLSQTHVANAAEESVIPENDAKSKSSGLPIPRFVSLKADRVNVRGGPSTEHKVDWVFRRIGLPVEIIQEFEHWRRVRDSEGAEGWVFHSLLSGRRTALVMPWSSQEDQTENSNKNNGQIPVHNDRSNRSSIVVNVEPGVLTNILECDGTWCHLSLDKYRGWIQQEKLWGVYRGEKVN